MGATLTTINDALKRVAHSDRLHDQLYQGNPFLEDIQKQTRHEVGEECRVVLHVSRNGGSTFLPPGGGTLNAAGNQGVAKAVYKYKNQHQQIAIQGDAIDGTSNNSLAVASIVDVEVSGALNDLKKQLTRCLFGNGDALVSGVRTGGASTEIELDAEDGFNAIERGWLFPGLPVDIGTTADEDSLIDGEVITDVEESATTPSITVSTSVSTTAGTHFVSLKNARSGTSSYEPNGLRNLVATSGEFGELDPANEPTWKAANADTTAQDLSLTLMLQQGQKIKQKSGDVPDFLLTGLKQERKFYELLQQQVRFTEGNIGAGNSDQPKWNGKEIHSHPDCPNEDMYFGIKKHLFIVATSKPYWQNAVTGSGKILEWIQGTDSYGAKLTYRFNLATDRRLAFARLGNLN